MEIPPAGRLPLLVLAIACLLTGLAAGLARLGLPLPSGAAPWHGPLMIGGFFGTVIGLERAVALRAAQYYAGPLASGLGGLALAFGLPPALAQGLIGLGSAVLLAGSLRVFLGQRVLHLLTLALGAGCWLAGNLLWLAGVPLAQVLPFWIGFLVLTVAGERLELSRLRQPSPAAKRAFAAIVAVLIAGMLLGLAAREAGVRLFAAALLACAAWLMTQDVARRTIMHPGLPRFIAVCLLSGYAWLALAAALMLWEGLAPGRAYDSALHSLLLGFVFAMVLGHAPVIFPAVLRTPMPWHPFAYLPLALLHASLALRVGGDLAGTHGLWAAGGAGNAAALLLFILGSAAMVIRGRR